VHRVGVAQEVAHQGVAHLVVGGDRAFLVRQQAALLFGAGQDPHDALFELGHVDDALAVAGRQQGRLVDQVGQIGAGEARRLGGQGVQVDVLGDRLAAGVDLQDGLAAGAVGAVDHDLAVEAARAQQGGVQDVGPVGGGDQDDVVFHLEAVHLDQQLVQGLLALVVAATHARAAMTSDGVDLVHEDDAGRVLLGLGEQVAHPAGAHPDEHLDEVRARDRKEGHPGLAGHGPRQQRLAGARRAEQQHALGDARAELLELLGVLQELLDLFELLDGLVDAGHVLEGDLGGVDADALGPALAEAHHLGAAALHLVHHEQPEPDDEHERQEIHEQAAPPRAARVLGDKLHVVLLDELGRGRGVGIGHLVVRAVVQGDRETQVLGVHDDLLHAAVLQVVDEALGRAGRRHRAGHRRDLVFGKQRRELRRVAEEHTIDRRRRGGRSRAR
jgi:hypothetical protein